MAVRPPQRSPGNAFSARRAETPQVGLWGQREDGRRAISVLTVSPIRCGIRSSLRDLSPKTEHNLPRFSLVPITEVSRNTPRAICSMPRGGQAGCAAVSLARCTPHSGPDERAGGRSRREWPSERMPTHPLGDDSTRTAGRLTSLHGGLSTQSKLQGCLLIGSSPLPRGL